MEKDRTNKEDYMNATVLTDVTINHFIDVQKTVSGLTGGWGKMREQIFNIMFNLDVDGDYLEIGSLYGASILAAAYASMLSERKRKHFSIDANIGVSKKLLFPQAPAHTNMGRLTLFFRNILLSGLKDSIFPIISDSLIAHEFLNLKLALLFVDGGHLYKFAYNDIVNYGKFLVPNGILLVHDYEADSQSDVERAVSDAMKVMNFKDMETLPGTLFYARKEGTEYY